jgi:large subunit ribosomal protein L29
MKKDEIKKLDSDALKKEVAQMKKELFNLKMNVSGGEVKDFSQFKKLRNDIARGLTFLNQKKAEKE